MLTLMKGDKAIEVAEEGAYTDLLVNFGHQDRHSGHLFS